MSSTTLIFGENLNFSKAALFIKEQKQPFFWTLSQNWGSRYNYLNPAITLKWESLISVEGLRTGSVQKDDVTRMIKISFHGSPNLTPSTDLIGFGKSEKICTCYWYNLCMCTIITVLHVKWVLYFVYIYGLT